MPLRKPQRGSGAAQASTAAVETDGAIGMAVDVAVDPESTEIRWPEDAAMRIVSRRYHLHFPGLVYIATTVMLAFGAVQSQNNLLFWAFGIAVAGLLISGIVSGSALMGLQMARLGVSESPVGRTTFMRYALRNRNRFFPAMALNIEELDVNSDPAPGAKSDPRVAPLSLPAGACELVAARTVVDCQTRALAKRRGRGSLRRVRVWTTYPFGLTRKSVTFEGPKSILVLPHVPRLKNGALDRILGADQRGVLTAATRGVSDEFWSLREYQIGDPTRSIAWKASARSGQLIVRQTAALTPVRLWVRIGELTDEAFETAVTLAAGMIRQADELGWSMGLWIPGSGVLIVPGQGQRHVHSLMRALAVASPRSLARASGAGPKSGDAVISIVGGRVSQEAQGGRASIGVDDAAELLEKGESLTPAPAVKARERSGLWSLLAGREAGGS